MGVSEGGRKTEKGGKNIWRNNVPNPPQFEERHDCIHAKIWMNSRQGKLTEMHTIAQPLKARKKDRILKAVEKKWLDIYKGSPIRLTARFFSETMEARRQWDDAYLKCWKKILPIKFYIQQNSLLKKEWEMKIFLDEKWRSISPADMPQEKYERESFRLKWEATKQWLEAMWKNKEQR